MTRSTAPALVEPAWSSIPPYKRTLGPEVADLARMVGFPPDPEQELALDALFALDEHNRSTVFELGLVACRQNLKTGLFKMAALGWLFITGQKLVVWSAHEFDTSQEAFRDMTELIEGSAYCTRRLKSIRRGNGDESIELMSKQRLKFKARTKSGGRGLTGDKVVLDEAFALMPSHMGSLLPTLSARPDPQVVYGSSAGLQYSAVLRGVRDRGRSGNHPRLAYLEWGNERGGCAHEKCAHELTAVGCALNDRDRWQRANPAMGRRITVEYIVAEREAMAAFPEEFARERLGWWDDPPETSEIDLAMWSQLGDPESKRIGEVAVGVDIAPNRDYAAIGLYGMRLDPDRPGEIDTDDQGRPLGHLQLVKYEPGTHWIVAALVEIRDVLGPVAIGMGRGTAKSLEVELAAAGFHLPTDPEQPERGDLAVTSALDMAAACGHVIDATRQGTDRHVPAQALDAAVTGAKTRQVGDTIAWSHKGDTDIAPLVSVTVARWAYLTRLEAVTKPPPKRKPRFAFG